jgi:glycosyltransferase
MMKISVITAVLNGENTIGETIASIRRQKLEGFEHIIIDGGSKDRSMEIIKKYGLKNGFILSAKDNGIYDALNKGIRLSSGDIIGFLHSGDYYTNERVLQRVAEIFEKQDVDSCYGDLFYVSKKNPRRVIRYWRSSVFQKGKFRKGWMPAHPTFFVKKKVFEKYGFFNTYFRIAADYELMLRFLEKHNISTYYIPEVLAKMRMGGESNKNIKNIFLKTREDYRAWKINNFNGGLVAVFLKNISKIPQFLPVSLRKWVAGNPGDSKI